ncbi:YfhO family protein, partial [bacterium]|nr:YfhO family protein [candidate division CSSED10-310 bacterium]
MIKRASYILPTLIFLLLLMAMLFPEALFFGKILFPTKILYLYEPWRSEFQSVAAESLNVILVDEVLEFYPWREYLRTRLLSGAIPLWDPTAFCGYPFMGLFQTAFLYVPDRLMDSLKFGDYCTFRAVFNILAAGIGMAVFLKRYKSSAVAASLGAVAYAGSGFLIVWMGHPHAKSAVWLPWIFWAVEIIQKKPKFGFITLTLAGTLALTAGHIETVLHMATAAGFYSVFKYGRQWVQKSYRPLIALVCASVVTLLISAAMLLPFAEYLSRSVAYETRSEGVVVQTYLDKTLMITHIMPKLFGSSENGTYSYAGFNFSKTGGFNSAEIMGAFIGVVPLILGLAGLLSKQCASFRSVFAVIVVFCAGVVYKFPLIYQLSQLLPGYKMSYNFRMVL